MERESGKWWYNNEEREKRKIKMERDEDRNGDDGRRGTKIKK